MKEKNKLNVVSGSWMKIRKANNRDIFFLYISNDFSGMKRDLHRLWIYSENEIE